MRFKRFVFITFILIILLTVSFVFIKQVQALGSLTAWWKMDESSGDAYDSSGGRLTLSNTNVTYSTGKINNAAVFNGTDAYLAGTAPDLANKSFSISGWLFANNLSADQVWMNIGLNSSTDEALHLRVTTTGAMRFGFFFDDLDTADGVFTAGVWHQVTYTYDASTNQRVIYLDGVQKASDIADGDFAGTVDAYVGSWQTDEPWDGKIDEVKIYNRVLTSSEIADLAAAGAGPDATLTTAVSSAVTWREVQPAGNTDLNWASAKLSRDGSLILVGAKDGGRLYISRDRGYTWNETQPMGDSEETWLALGMSGGGENILAADYGSRLFVSHNKGNTWTDTLADGDQGSNWSTASVSGDGQTMIAGINSGRLFISTNGGTTWSETRPAGDNDQQWITSAINDDGGVIFVGGYGGRLYRSTNKGVSWTEMQPAGNSTFNWGALAVGKSGQTVFAGIDDAGSRTGLTYLSTNGGDTWTLDVPDGSLQAEWRLASMSDDSRVILAGHSDTIFGRLWLSQDSGQNWAEAQPAGDVDKFWNAGSVSGDGFTIIAAVGNSSGNRRVYIGTLPYPEDRSPRFGSEVSKACTDTIPARSPDLFQINTTSTSATLYFSPIENVSNFVIAYGYKEGDLHFGAETDKAVMNGVNTYTINNLSPNTKYYFSVRGNNGCASGQWGKWVSAKTTKNGKWYR